MTIFTSANFELLYSDAPYKSIGSRTEIFFYDRAFMALKNAEEVRRQMILEGATSIFMSLGTEGGLK